MKVRPAMSKAILRSPPLRWRMAGRRACLSLEKRHGHCCGRQGGFIEPPGCAGTATKAVRVQIPACRRRPNPERADVGVGGKSCRIPLRWRNRRRSAGVVWSGAAVRLRHTRVRSQELPAALLLAQHKAYFPAVAQECEKGSLLALSGAAPAIPWKTQAPGVKLVPMAFLRIRLIPARKAAVGSRAWATGASAHHAGVGRSRRGRFPARAPKSVPVVQCGRQGVAA
jgi:hypothetical protein